MELDLREMRRRAAQATMLTKIRGAFAIEHRKEEALSERRRSRWRRLRQWSVWGLLGAIAALGAAYCVLSTI